MLDKTITTIVQEKANRGTDAWKFYYGNHSFDFAHRTKAWVDRSEYADELEANTQRVKENPDYYRKRQQIAEHMYGTLKQQRGFTHTNVRGKEKVLGEVGLVFIGYNLTRCISILGVTNLIKKLRESCLPVLKSKSRLIFKHF